MRWKQFFTPVDSLNAKEAQDLLSKEQPIELLDVRQPGEYKQGHIAGAKLIPLPNLGDSLDHLDPDKPVIVY